MTDTGDTRIRLACSGQIATITIDRPDKLNALDYEMVLALEHAAHLIDAMTGVRAAIITGSGTRSFCAGSDIEAWSARSPQDFGLAWVRHGHRAFDALARLRQPLIAALNGHTLGGGLEIAATADFRIAEAHVKLGSPERPGSASFPAGQAPSARCAALVRRPCAAWRCWARYSRPSRASPWG